MLNIIRKFFIGVLIIGILWVLGAMGSKETFNDPKFAFVGIGVLVSSIIVLVLLNRIALHYEKNKANYDKFRIRFILIILIIIIGVVNLICGITGLIQDNSIGGNPGFVIMGGAFIFLGLITFRSLQEQK